VEGLRSLNGPIYLKEVWGFNHTGGEFPKGLEGFKYLPRVEL